jgi:hypothetical protein
MLAVAGILTSEVLGLTEKWWIPECAAPCERHSPRGA